MKAEKIILTVILAMAIESFSLQVWGEKVKGDFLSLGNKDKFPSEIERRKLEIEVKFYKLTKKTGNNGQFLGGARLKDGTLTYDVTYPKLKKMLKYDYHTIVSVIEKGKIIDKPVIYKVGTPEHLQSIIDNCKYIGCIGEIATIE